MRVDAKSRREENLSKIRSVLKVVVLLVLVALVGYGAYKIPKLKEEISLFKEKEVVVTSEYVEERLSNVSKLTTAELSYTGLIHYAEGSIPYITQKSFNMIYTAEIEAGIDASEMEITVTDTEVRVVIPAATVQSVNIDPDTIAFYDEKKALFNWEEKQDALDAMSAAEDDAMENADINGLLERSDEQATEIVRGILSGNIGERQLIIDHKSSEEDSSDN